MQFWKLHFYPQVSSESQTFQHDKTTPLKLLYKFWDIPLTWLGKKLTCNLFLSLLQDLGQGWGMILFQKKILTLNTGSICVILTEMLAGSCKAGSLSKCIIFLGKVPCPIPRHLMAKSAQCIGCTVDSKHRMVSQLLSTKNADYLCQARLICNHYLQLQLGYVLWLRLLHTAENDHYYIIIIH